MIRHLSDGHPAWRCSTCEVGWASPQLWPLCWLCRRRGERGDVRALVAWFCHDRTENGTEEARRG